MWDIIRDSTIGQIINALSNGHFLPYKDQKPGYVVPARYLLVIPEISSAQSIPISPTPFSGTDADTITGDELTLKKSRSPSLQDGGEKSGLETPATATSAFDPENQLEKGSSVFEKMRNEAATTAPATTEAMAAEPETYPYLVDWDGPLDPDNPRNWSLQKRSFVAFSISLLTFSVYIGSAIYTSSIPSLLSSFPITPTQAALGLTLYVLAYGIGPMFLTPLQELPALGRNPVYILGLGMFVVLNVPIVTVTASASGFRTVLAMRFWTGFVGSPALATGGASMADIFPPQVLPYLIGIWALSAVAGPVAGPVIGGFAAESHSSGWRYPIYELISISSFSLLFLSLLLPETYEPTILLKRAKRLRKLTGNAALRSASEVEVEERMGKGGGVKEIVYESLVRPFVLVAEPALLFSHLYIGFVYSIFYLWFESFPLVFNEMYGMSLGVGSLPFTGFLVSGTLTYIFYALYLRHHMEPRFKKYGFLAPEARLEIGLMASVFIPLSMLLFGWTARPSVPWIVPVIAAALYLPGVFLTFQSFMMYLAMSYPKYAGSVFAGNDLFRWLIHGKRLPLFGTAFFRNLGVGPGSTLLAGISLILIPIFYLLVRYGDRLRARSRYATA